MPTQRHHAARLPGARRMHVLAAQHVLCRLDCVSAVPLPARWADTAGPQPGFGHHQRGVEQFVHGHAVGGVPEHFYQRADGGRERHEWEYGVQ